MLNAILNDLHVEANTHEKGSNHVASYIESLQSLEGRRIIDIKCFMTEVLQMVNHHPFSCSLETVRFISEKRIGLQSTFCFKCSMCNKSFKLHTENDLVGNQKPNPGNNANNAFVSGTISIGNGFSQAQELAGVLNLPFMAKKTFSNHESIVADLWEETARDAMSKAAMEEKQIAINKGNVDEDGIPMITVVVDGAWSKRSYRTNYTSLSGVAAIVGYETKMVLYMGVRNKYCAFCTHHKNKSPMPIHKYSKNWEGSSSSMEDDIILQGFNMSLETYGLKYYRFIGDGDSSVERSIKECMPYAPQQVEKIECRNHLIRNFMSKLQDDIWNAKGKAKLGSSEIRTYCEKNAGRIVKAIYGAIRYRRSEDGLSEIKKIEHLKKDFLNIPSHVFGDHTRC